MPPRRKRSTARKRSINARISEVDLEEKCNLARSALLLSCAYLLELLLPALLGFRLGQYALPGGRDERHALLVRLEECLQFRNELTPRALGIELKDEVVLPRNPQQHQGLAVPGLALLEKRMRKVLA